MKKLLFLSIALLSVAGINASHLQKAALHTKLAVAHVKKSAQLAQTVSQQTTNTQIQNVSPGDHLMNAIQSTSGLAPQYSASYKYIAVEGTPQMNGRTSKIPVRSFNQYLTQNSTRASMPGAPSQVSLGLSKNAPLGAVFTIYQHKTSGMTAPFKQGPTPDIVQQAPNVSATSMGTFRVVAPAKKPHMGVWGPAILQYHSIVQGGMLDLPTSNGQSEGTQGFRSYSYSMNVSPAKNAQYAHLQYIDPKIPRTSMIVGGHDNSSWQFNVSQKMPVGTVINVYQHAGKSKQLYQIYKVVAPEKIYKK